MTEPTEELSAELAVEHDVAMIAEGSVLDAMRQGDFEAARSAIDEAEAAWNRRLELFEEIAEMFAVEPQ